jgi:hypothetical protein
MDAVQSQPILNGQQHDHSKSVGGAYTGRVSQQHRLAIWRAVVSLNHHSSYDTAGVHDDVLCCIYMLCIACMAEESTVAG